MPSPDFESVFRSLRNAANELDLMVEVPVKPPEARRLPPRPVRYALPNPPRFICRSH